MFMTKPPMSIEEIENNPDLKALQEIVNEYEPEGVCALSLWCRF